MKALVDTSAWIEHLKKPVPALVGLLEERCALVHPLVIGELACGTLKRRHDFLGNLKILPKAAEATFEECLEVIEDRKLHGRGLSFTDVQLLASALISDSRILSFDRALNAAASTLGVRLIKAR
jgi:predicted nucleic acid-binding protein